MVQDQRVLVLVLVLDTRMTVMEDLLSMQYEPAIVLLIFRCCNRRLPADLQDRCRMSCVGRRASGRQELIEVFVEPTWKDDQVPRSRCQKLSGAVNQVALHTCVHVLSAVSSLC